VDDDGDGDGDGELKAVGNSEVVLVVGDGVFIPVVPLVGEAVGP